MFNRWVDLCESVCTGVLLPMILQCLVSRYVSCPVESVGGGWPCGDYVSICDCDRSPVVFD
jgi:hypothetical protein